MANKNEYDGPPIRTGTWGPRKQECRIIENFDRPPGAQHGRYTIDYLPGDMYKIMYSQFDCNQRVCSGHEFLRYADGVQIEEMANVIMSGDGAKFVAIVHDVRARVNNNGKPKRANGDIDRGWGGEKEVCDWIEGHDEVFVSYHGTDKVWPNGCWEVISADATRQLLDVDQLYYVAQEILGMPKTSRPKAREYDAFSPAPDIADLFGGVQKDDMATLFTSLQTQEGPSQARASAQSHEQALEDLFATPPSAIERAIAKEARNTKAKIGARLRATEYFEDPLEALFGAPPEQDDDNDIEALFGGL